MDEQPHEHKIIIAGNHELGWVDEGRRNTLLDQFGTLNYLHNSDIEIDGIKFWGSPYQPFFFDWAFQMKRGAELAANWAQIPDDTDVLITHGPPYGFGDTCPGSSRFGDQDLLERVLKVKPTIHCYGHAHDGYGEYFFEGIHFINAALLNDKYHMQNKPIVVDVPSSRNEEP